MLGVIIFTFPQLPVCCDGNWCPLPHDFTTRALLKYLRPHGQGLNLTELSTKINPPSLVFLQAFLLQQHKNNS